MLDTIQAAQDTCKHFELTKKWSQQSLKIYSRRQMTCSPTQTVYIDLMADIVNELNQ